MDEKQPITPTLEVSFFKSRQDNEPVREWLKQLDKNDRKAIGADISTIQFRWPMGMPLVRKIESNLWEARSNIGDGIARVLFTVQNGEMVLLHGFIKKSPSLPHNDLAVAKSRLSLLQEKKQ
jgi:phage-related protein